MQKIFTAWRKNGQSAKRKDQELTELIFDKMQIKRRVFLGLKTYTAQKQLEKELFIRKEVELDLWNL